MSYQTPFTLSEEVHRVNKEVKRTLEQDKVLKKGRGKYNNYTADERE